mgnify:CR=1 FL=1
MDSYNKIWMIIRKTDLLNQDERDKLHLYLMNLKDQVKKQKEVIDKAIELLKSQEQDMMGNYFFDDNIAEQLLDILKEAK